MRNLWSRAQFEHRFIVLSFTKLTVRNIATWNCCTVNEPLLSIDIALGVTEIDIFIQLVGRASKWLFAQRISVPNIEFLYHQTAMLKVHACVVMVTNCA